MKDLAVLLFTLSIYLLLPNPTLSTRNNPIRLHTADDTPVVDTDGDELRAGGDYIITSAIPGSTGPHEVTLSRRDLWTSTCPDVVTTTYPSSADGVPVTITPADPSATVVSPSTYLSFSFNNVPAPWDCTKTLYWLVYRFPETSSRDFVNAGEFLSNNSNQFKIEKAEPNSYKITYCHFGTDNECNNVGLMLDPWLRAFRLVLSEDPFVVVFKKAS